MHGGGEHGAGEHELPAEAGAFRFQGVQVQRGTGIDDGADATERGHRLAGAMPVFVQTLGNQDAVHLGVAEQFQLRQQFLAVVHHLMGAHGLAPVGGGLAPGGGNHGQPEMVGGQLDSDGAHATGAADHQQAFPFTLSRLKAELVFQGFPGGQGGKGQGGGFLHAQAIRLLRHQPLVHALVLGIAALTLQGAGVPDPVTTLKVLYLGAYCFHHACGIKPQYPIAALVHRALAQFGINGIH